MTRRIPLIFKYLCRIHVILMFGFFFVFVLFMSGCSSDGNGSGTVNTITVTDSHYLGTLGDDDISISEAIRLATGEIALSDLSSNEASFVKGVPGSGRADRIQMKQGLKISIERREEAVDTILPILYDEGDILEGNGAVFDGSPMEGLAQTAPGESFSVTDEGYGIVPASAPLIVIGASDVEVRGLSIENVPASAIVVVGGPGEGNHGMVVRDNTIRGLGRNSPSNGISVSAGFNVDEYAITNVTIQNNIINDTQSGIFVSAATAFGPEAYARNNRIDGVTITGNRIERPLTGIYFAAASCHPGGSAKDNMISNVEIVENLIDSNLDCGMVGSTTGTQFGGAAARNTIRNVTICDNTITCPEDDSRINTGIFQSCGQIFLGGTSEDDTYDGLVIERNIIEKQETGLTLFPGYAERCGDEAKVGRSTMRNVIVRDNQWLNVTNGCLLSGATGTEMSGLVDGNLLSDIVFERETVVANQVGFLIAGSLAANIEIGDDCILCWMALPGYNLPGEETGNSVHGLVMRDCSIQAPTPVIIMGGSVTAEDDTVESSTVEEVVLSNNTITGPAPEIVILGGIVTDLGTVRESSVQNVQVVGNHDTEGSASQVYYIDETVINAPAESVSGNHVSIVDITSGE